MLISLAKTHIYQQQYEDSLSGIGAQLLVSLRQKALQQNKGVGNTFDHEVDCTCQHQERLQCVRVDHGRQSSW